MAHAAPASVAVSTGHRAISTLRLGAADVGPEGNDLARRLPDAHYVEIAPASHFTFLSACKPGAVEMLEEEGDDPICSDPEGTDRRATHQRLIDAIAGGLGL